MLSGSLLITAEAAAPAASAGITAPPIPAPRAMNCRSTEYDENLRLELK